MRKNSINLTMILMLVLFFGSACQALKSTKDKQSETRTAPISSDASAGAAKDNKDTQSSEIEKADFTFTSEELDKEFTREGVKSSDLEKYASKIIAVSGRVSMLVKEKKGTVQPWVTLYAPGVLNGINCYFDDDNVYQMEKLAKDKMAKVQGFQNDFVVPKVPPRLEHCVVLEGS